MHEVISLLSSPLASPLKPSPPPARLPTKTKVLTAVHFDSDDFDTTGDLRFSISQPAKKRRISGPKAEREKSVIQSHAKVFDAPFELSSDNALPILGSPGQRFDQGNGNLSYTQVHEIDEIVFSSSAPARTRTETKKQPFEAEVYDLSSDSLPDDPFDGHLSASQPVNDGAEFGKTFSERTTNLLAGLVQDAPKQSKSKSKPKTKGSSGEGVPPFVSMNARDIDIMLDDIVASSPPKISSRSDKAYGKESTKQTKVAAKRTQMATEKEAEKARKQSEKAQKARDKQKAADLAEVNRSKTKKKDAIAEMLVKVSGHIQGTSIGNQIEEYFKHAEVPMSYAEEQVNLEDESVRFQDLGGIIRWKRKVTAVYDENAGQWMPASKSHIKTEQHVMVYLKAIDFAMIAAGYSGEDKPSVPSDHTMHENFDLHVTALRSRFANCTPIYLIEGMHSWLKKNQNARNRDFITAVRAKELVEENADSITTSKSKLRKRKKPPAVDFSFITEDIMEDLLLHIQLTHQPIFIQHTSPPTTAAQIVAFTEHLSTRPYRQIELAQNVKTASFCMASGQVKTGDDVQDTYIKMLQEVQRVTPAMAYGIAGEYASVRQLVEGFRREGNLMLEDVRKSANKDGAWTDRRLGPMVSKRLYKVFMGRDAATMDGMS